MQQLKINGTEKQFPDGIPGTLAKLLEQLNIEPATVVAEIDNQIIERTKFAQTHLSENQSIELIKFAPGG